MAMNRLLVAGLLSLSLSSSNITRFPLSLRSPLTAVAAPQSPDTSGEVFHWRPRSGTTPTSCGFRFTVPQGYQVIPGTTSIETPTPIQTLEVWSQSDALNRDRLIESPPIIRIAIYPNPQQLPLTHWQSDLSYNNVSPLSVADQAAIAYSATGLYEADHVLLPSPTGQCVLRLEGAYLRTTDPIRQALREILASWQFESVDQAVDCNQSSPQRE